MKEHTSHLLSVAQNDLDLAMKILMEDPANAAYHAQQCSEKAIKALVFELGDYKEASHFDKICKGKIGHDTTLACFTIMSMMIDKQWKRSGFEQKLAHYRYLMMERKDKGAILPYYLGIQAQTWLQDILSAFNNSPLEFTDEYWYKSLDPNLKPEPNYEKWYKRASEVMENAYEVWNAIVSKLDMPSEAYNLLNTSTDVSQRVLILERIIESMRIKGSVNTAIEFQDNLDNLKRLFGPRFEFITWLTLIINWTPYLDIHAEIGRYQDMAHYKIYKEHVDGVKNLISKAEEILKQTKIVSSILKREGF